MCYAKLKFLQCLGSLAARAHVAFGVIAQSKFNHKLGLQANPLPRKYVISAMADSSSMLALIRNLANSRMLYKRCL